MSYNQGKEITLPISRKQKLFDRYLDVRLRTEKLCGPLKDEDYIPQADYFVSPPKWHLAHTTWFFEKFILEKYDPSYRHFHKDFNFLFNSYYNALGERVPRHQRGLLTRPTVDQVYSYRRHVDHHLLVYFNDDNNVTDEVLDLILLGTHHEQQHQELLMTDLKYTLSYNPIHPVYDKAHDWMSLQDTDNQNYIKINSGLYEIGHEGDHFCYDNEKGRHQVYLHPFEISSNLVTNEAYMEFIASGGYGNHDLWLDEGWAWVNTQNIAKPLYWVKKKNKWYQYTLAGLKPIHPKVPVCHVNFYEASAFAQWCSMRLPTEFEWEVASPQLGWGLRWEWTSSAYSPYPGFQKNEGAVGEYNAKFMVNQMVLRGGSVATPQGHSRHTYRNFFHPDARWQFTGIRLVK